MKTFQRQDRQKQWMMEYETLIKTRSDYISHAGCIDWDTAGYLFLQGKSPKEAFLTIKNVYKH